MYVWGSDMQRILLSCKSINDARFLKNYIETELPYEVLLNLDPKDIEQAIKTKNVHMVMMQTGNLASQDIAFAQQLRKLGYTYPMLMITDALGTANIEELNQKHKIYFLERPFELST